MTSRGSTGPSRADRSKLPVVANKVGVKLNVAMRKDPTPYIVAAFRLKHRREFLGFTAAHVASRLGVDAPRYLHWEKVFGPLLSAPA